MDGLFDRRKYIWHERKKMLKSTINIWNKIWLIVKYYLNEKILKSTKQHVLYIGVQFTV